MILNRLRFSSVKIATKLWVGMAIILLCSVVALGSMWGGMNEVKVRFTQFIEHDQKLANAYSGMYAQGLQMGQALRNVLLDPANPKAWTNLGKARESFDGLLVQANQLMDTDDAARPGLSEIQTIAARQAQVHTRLLATVKAGDLTQARKLLNDEETPAWRAMKRILLDSGQEFKARAKSSSLDVAARVRSSEQVALVASVATLLVILVLTPLLIHAIVRPLKQAIGVAERIAEGNLDNQIDIQGADETARLLQSLSQMQANLKQRTEAEHRSAAEMSRVKSALDKASTNMMVADDQGLIIYTNEAMIQMLRVAENDIRKTLPGFHADRLIGRNFDDFHRDPGHHRNLLARLTSAHTTQIGIGGRTFRLISNPVTNSAGQRLGSVVEWTDRTAEVRAEQELEQLLKSVASGDFSQRLNVDDKTGFFRDLATGMNALTDIVERALQDLAGVLEALANSDLTRKISTSYEGTFAQLRDDANLTVDHLQDVVSGIKDAADFIRRATSEIAAGNSDLSARTEEQASSLEETSSSMEELTATVQQNADNAERADELAQGASKIATRGGEVVEQVVATMGEIQESSRKINDIIEVIDGIAFQTNILALNAAVEAARAGEQGRGFAVVAAEVRTLAQRSAQAAKEIGSLIGDSVRRVDTGSELVSKAGQTMSEIQESFHGVTGLIGQISNASREQQAGIEQVTQAVAQMEEGTQRNASLVEEASAAAASLEDQARALAEAVAVFRLQSNAQTSAEVLLLSAG